MWYIIIVKLFMENIIFKGAFYKWIIIFYLYRGVQTRPILCMVCLSSLWIKRHTSPKMMKESSQVEPFMPKTSTTPRKRSEPMVAQNYKAHCLQQRLVPFIKKNTILGETAFSGQTRHPLIMQFQFFVIWNANKFLLWRSATIRLMFHIAVPLSFYMQRSKDEF